MEHAYLIQMDTFSDMDMLHNRWSIQYQDLNRIHDLRVEEARLTNQPTSTLHSTLWYYVYNVYMTELFIMYTNWTPQIDGLVRYCLTHGIKVRLYDNTTLYDVTIRPICNIGKVRHINDLPEAPRYGKHIVVEEVVYVDRHGCKTTVTEHVGVDMSLNTDAIQARLFRIYNRLLNQNIRENRRLQQQQWLTVQAERRVKELWPVGELLDVEKIRANIARIYQEYRVQWDTPDGPVSVEMVNNFDPLKDQETLTSFGQTWSWLYSLDTPDNEHEAIANAIVILYYLSNDIEPCAEKPDEFWTKQDNSPMYRLGFVKKDGHPKG